MNTTRLRGLLRDRYPPPEWVMAFEVQAERDEGGLRFADAVAFDTRKGAGMAVHGFELKISRADWLNEVKDPAKALPARSLCDYWWVVAGGPGIIERGELPPGVGLLVAEEAGFNVSVHAKRPRLGPRAFGLDRALVAAMLRRLDPIEPRTYWEGRERRAEQKGFAKGRNEAVRVAGKKARSRPEEPKVGPGGVFCP